MRVSVEIPEPKTGLDTALAKQFVDIQRQLMGMVKTQDDSKQSMHVMMMECMEEQQTSLLHAMERLMGMMQKSHQPSEAMVQALRGLKHTVSELPGDLKDALDHQSRGVHERAMKVSVRPHVTVAMPSGLVHRIDSLESALLNGLRRSRNRTFGSNY